jgi:hypothetical protein
MSCVLNNTKTVHTEASLLEHFLLSLNSAHHTAPAQDSSDANTNTITSSTSTSSSSVVTVAVRNVLVTEQSMLEEDVRAMGTVSMAVMAKIIWLSN